MKESRESSLPDFWGRHSLADFRREFNDLVENFFAGKSVDWPKTGLSVALPKGVLQPSIDIKENDKSVVLTAELPGLEEKDVDVTVREGMLTLKGEKKMEEKREDEDMHVMERRYGSFQRTIDLPDRVDAGAITAAFANGVLTVTMPKKAEKAASVRKIPVGK